MSRTNLTMADIARICGVARSTVHAVLKGKPGVSARTRAKVLDAVARFDYSPCPIAKSLARKKSGLVGVVIRDLANPFYDQFLKHMDHVLKDLRVITFNTRHDIDKEIHALRTLAGYRADGLIIAPVQPERAADHLGDWVERGGALVSLDRLPGIECSYVEFRNFDIGRMTTEYAIRLGHRAICMLAGPPRDDARDDERVAGFKACLREQGLDPAECTVQHVGWRWEGGFHAASEFFSGARRCPSLFICNNDYVAGGVYKAAYVHRLRIPDQVSVIGCDDIGLAAVLGPSLTTVRLNARGIGEGVARMLLRQMNQGSAFQPRSIAVAPMLVERESVLNLTATDSAEACCQACRERADAAQREEAACLSKG
ncbi:MAG TPA: LacI family DNA-binding transcriptional regulator [Candidatus Sumerlaeota bacterium]|nr:LacI family DNA-binding transcriptional regulator [Candidatus Sumerlaeota bacterium]HOR28449.1 LacI family DNA-binding transcriptional regulator [Candidatus Sumerlaeota bacterium]HPK01610.1 LacI family DNA-binding transcriptional regulator [Candidatus Sumerlaeota bacterium]